MMLRRMLPVIVLLTAVFLLFTLLPMGAGLGRGPDDAATISTSGVYSGASSSVSSKATYSESEANDLATTANAFTAGTPGDPASISGVLSSGTDEDWFKLTVSGVAPGYLNVSLRTPQSASAIDYEVQVFEKDDAAGSNAFMYTSDSGLNNEDPELVTCWAAGPGFYLMRVKTLGSSSVSANGYWLNVSFDAQALMIVEDEIMDKAYPNDVSSEADWIDVDGPGKLKTSEFFGTIRSTTDVDWYELDLYGTSGGRLNITLESFWNDASGTHGSHYLSFNLYGPLPTGETDSDRMLAGTDYGGGGGSVFTVSMAQTRLYLLKVYDASGSSHSPFEPYRVNINFTPAKEEDPSIQLESDLLDPAPSDNTNSSGATSITLSSVGGSTYNGTAWGTLVTDSDVDWFKFDIPGTTWGSLDLAFDTPYDAMFSLNPYYYYVFYRADNLTKPHINTTNYGNQGPYTDSLLGVRDGTYYIKVYWSSAGSRASKGEPYMLHLSFTADTSLPVEKEHLTDALNNDTAAAETLTMLAPGGGRSYFLGEIYGSLSNATDVDNYVFEFTHTHTGDFRIYVKTPNHFPSIQYSYEFYGPDGLTHYAAGMSQNGVSSEQQLSPTIPGGLPGKYLLRVSGDGVFDPGHLYYARIEFEPLDTSTYQLVGSIYGNVVNNFTDAPIENATITIEGQNAMLQWEAWGAYVTDAAGDYSSSKLPKQDIRVHVLTNGYREQFHTTTMVDQDVNIDLRLEPTYGDLQGTVYADDFKTIAFANVEILGTGLSVLTDTDGTYSILNVPTGFYTIRFSAPDHKAATIDTQILEAETTTLNAYLDRMTGDLQVFLKDENGNNVTVATVNAWRQYVGTVPMYYTNLGGYSAFWASGLLVGNWSVLVTGTDYAAVNQTVRIKMDETASVNISLANMTFTLDIIDIDTGSELTSSSLNVNLYSVDKLEADIVTQADADAFYVTNAYWDSAAGYWKMSSPPIGEYLLNITDRYWSLANPDLYNRYVPYEEKVTIPKDNTHLVINVSKPGFRVRITDGVTKEPVTSSSVTLTSNEDATDKITLSNSYTGVYQYQNIISEGSYTLSITDSNYKDHQEQVDVTGISTLVEVELFRSTMTMNAVPAVLYQDRENQVVITITDNETGDPVQSVSVTHSLATGYYSSVYTDSDGKATLSITPYTGILTVTVTATKSDYYTATRILSVIDSDILSGFLSGTVRDGDHTPIPNLELELYDIQSFDDRVQIDTNGNTPVLTATTNSAGYYSFSNISFVTTEGAWSQTFTLMPAKYQGYRISGYTFYEAVEFSYASWSLPRDLTVYSNNKVSLDEERTPGSSYDYYGGEVYPVYELTDDGHRFRIWVTDPDNDKPEYVKVVIDDKDFFLTPMTGRDTYGDPVDPDMASGRYYQVVIDDSELESGEYDYEFQARDSWQTGITVLEGDDAIRITSLREIILQDNLIILGVMGVIFIITLILFIIAKVKNRKGGYEITNKALSTDSMGYYLGSLDLPVSESESEFNDLRKKFIQGQITAKEFIKRLK